MTGLVLAGGTGTRMSTDGSPVEKGLVTFCGRPLVGHVIDRLAPQVSAMLINANRHPERYRTFGHPVVADLLPGHPGPLSGIHAGLQAATTEWVATVPCDSPFLRRDLVERLLAASAADGVRLAVARNRGDDEPVFMLLHRSLAPSVEQALRGGLRSVMAWAARHERAYADFDDPKAFANLNTPDDLLAHAES